MPRSYFFLAFWFQFSAPTFLPVFAFPDGDSIALVMSLSSAVTCWWFHVPGVLFHLEAVAFFVVQGHKADLPRLRDSRECYCYMLCVARGKLHTARNQNYAVPPQASTAYHGRNVVGQ